jgi:kynurenine formamidase
VEFTQMMGEACVVDVPAGGDRDYLITVTDLHNWERANGPFHADCIVLVRSGVEKHWGDINGFMGSDDPYHVNAMGWPDNMHWPGAQSVFASSTTLFQHYHPPQDSGLSTSVR